MGNQLKETYHNKIIVKDTDDLHQEYQNLKTNIDYQDYIYHFIKQNPNIPIIFVGLVNSPTHVLDLNTNHKFYIEIPLAQNLKQKFFRSAEYLSNKREKLFERYLADPIAIQKKLFYLVNFDKWKDEITSDNNIYAKNNYIFAGPGEIMESVQKILSMQKGGSNDYYTKYLKYKNKYQMTKQIGGAQKCTIDSNDKILFGYGGSTAIIVLTENKLAYKFFTSSLHNRHLDDTYLERNKILDDDIDNEIQITKLLTKNIVDKKISPHYVIYQTDYICNDIKKIFEKCPKKYIEYLKKNTNKNNKLCDKLYQNYPNIKIRNKFPVLEMEYCDYTCADFIKDVSQMSILEMQKCLDIFFFQIIYTILSTQKIYPYFVHGDLFMRNILGLRETDNNNYYTYKFDKNTYYVPKKCFFTKISDFGTTNLNKEHRRFKLIKSDVKDIYNILYDVYDGGNLGSTSLMELCKEDENKKKFIKEYFSNYFDIAKVDEFNDKSQQNMNRDWNNILDKEFMQEIKMKNPYDLINGYFYDIFNKINMSIKVYRSA